MSTVGEVQNRSTERPAYVTFHRVPVEDHAASRRSDHVVFKDVDMAHITQAGSRDIFKMEVTRWLDRMQQEVAAGRLNPDWAEKYKAAYETWKRGQEIPLEGTPIKGWAVISPAQQETLLRMNILTVEDLAAITSDGSQQLGMGAMEMKHKAAAWLAQLQDKGPLTMKMAALETENTNLKGSVETLTRQVEELLKAVRVQNQVQAGTPTESIGLDDILDQPSPKGRKRSSGNPKED